jgi:hypothetical protein
MLDRCIGAAVRNLILFVGATLLTACGGGGGSDSGGFLGGGTSGEQPPATWTISATLTDSAGAPVTTLNEGEQATLLVTLSDPQAGGAPLPGEIVSVDASLVTIDPQAGTVTTSNDGQALFTVTGGDTSGAGSVVASAEGPNGIVSVQINFNVITDPTNEWSVTAALLNETGSQTNQIDPLAAGILTATVVDGDGNAVVDAIVSASTTLGRLIPEVGTALTDSNGIATFRIEADGVSGAGTATVEAVNPDGIGIVDDLNFAIDAELPYTISAVTRTLGGQAEDSFETFETFSLAVTLTEEDTAIPVASQIVSIDIGELGTTTPSSGNALTNANGVATFEITAGADSGAFTITISSIVAGGTVTTSIPVTLAQAERRLGFFNDQGSFVAGQIKVEPAKQLSPGGTAVLTIAVVDSANQRVSSEDTITLASDCIFSNQATIDPANPVAVTGQVAISYTVVGCEGADTVTATLESTGAQASGVIEIASLNAETISFVSATPEIIALRDTGNASDLSESAAVSFRVTDLNGNPITDAKVNFSLTTAIGGVALFCSGDPICQPTSGGGSRSSLSTDRSDLQGIATAQLLSGSVATPVRVIAYIDLDEDNVQDDNEPQSSSKALVITTGLPDQDSISLSASPLNVEGAMDTDGRTSEVTVRMADKFNNPVPDGTQATFTTEYGSIVGSCITASGACTVTWTSQSPRFSNSVPLGPIRIIGDDRYNCAAHNVLRNGEPGGPCPFDLGSPRGGRSTVLVYALGEESFIDANGNGVYNAGESFQNLTEAFNDENEDGVYTPAQVTGCSTASTDPVCLAGVEEEFIDFNQNGLFDLNDSPSLFNGVLCQPADADAGVCSRELVNVRDSLVIVNSFSDAGQFDLAVVDPSSGNEPPELDDDINYFLYVADIYNNPPPAGTEISFEGSGRCDVLTPTPTLGDTSRAGAFTTRLSVSTADGEQATADPDQVSILLTLPGGSTTVRTYPCLVDDPL